MGDSTLTILSQSHFFATKDFITKAGIARLSSYGTGSQFYSRGLYQNPSFLIGDSGDSYGFVFINEYPDLPSCLEDLESKQRNSKLEYFYVQGWELYPNGKIRGSAIELKCHGSNCICITLQ